MERNILSTGIEVWVVRLDRSFAIHNRQLLNNQFSNLNPEEQEKALNFYFTEDKIRFIQSRYLLKSIIANYLIKNIREIKFKYNEYGKPELIDNEDNLYFNISHSSQLVVMAFTKKNQLGVDIEFINDAQDIDYLINKDIFTDKELSYFDNLNKHNKRVVFYKLWAGKEAYLKALGIGLNIPLSDIEIELSKENIKLINNKIPNINALDKNYYLKELENIPSQYLGFLAIPAGVSRIRYYKNKELEV